MIISGWRITKAKYASDAFSGQAASDFGGRWNSSGTRVVYTASSTSLALLEILVHTGHPPALSAYVLIRASFEDTLILDLERKALLPSWRDHPPPTETQDIGDQWVGDGRSCILSVPSVIIPEETNYLINPSHPDFADIAIDDPTVFTIDERLLGTAE